MEIGQAFTFVTSEDNWITKIGIGALLSLLSGIIPIIPTLLLVGYAVKVGRNVLAGEEHPLPDWEDWGQLFMDGAVVWIVMFLYALPLMIFGLCLGLLWVPAALDWADGAEFAISALSGAATAGVVALCCLMLLYFLFYLVLVPAIFVQYVRTGEFGPLFRVGEVFSLARNHIGDIIIAVVAVVVAGLALGLISTILSITICGGIIAMFVGTAWITVAEGHMAGQIAAKAEGKTFDMGYSA